MIDRILDLFIGFYNPDGSLENRLYVVVFNNLNTNLVMEGLMVGLPIFLHKMDIRAYQYALYKLPRYGRMFE
jgi:hypothetical protein